MADTLIGRMQAVLGLDASSFEKTLDRSGLRAKGFGQELQQMASRVGAALSAGVAAVGGITVATINAADEVARLAAVANTTPETFQRWSSAAQAVGFEQEKVADVLKDVNDRVGDFLQTGGGPMADFFENIAPKVGVTADQFRRLSGPEALQLYVDSLQKAGANQQEMTFYLEAMASDATVLLPLLRDNGAELGRLADSAQSMGAILDGETIAAMQETRVEMMQIGQAMTGVRNQIAAAALPAVQAFASVLVDAASTGGVLNRAITVTLGNLDRIAAYATAAAAAFGTSLVGGFVAARVAAMSFAGSLAFVRTALIRTGVGALIVGLGELLLQFGRLVSAAGGVGDAFNLLGEIGRSVMNEIGQAGLALQHALRAVAWGIARNFVVAFKWIFDAWDKLVNSLLAPFNAVMSAIGSDIRLQAVNPISQALDGLAQDFEGYGVAAAEAAGTVYRGMAETRAAIEELRSTLRGMDEDTSDAEDALTRLNTQLDNLDGVGDGGSADRASKGVKKIGEKAEETNAAVDQLRNGMSNAFASIVTGASSAREAMSQLLGQIANMLANAAFQSMFSGMFGAGGSGATLSIPAFANGTLSAPGGLAQINERGGEIVNLPRGSQVIPHDISMEMARGATAARSTDVNVRVSVDQNGNLQAFVDQRAAIAAGAVTTNYDRTIMARKLGNRKVG